MLESIKIRAMRKLRDGGIERRYPRKVDYTIVKFIIRNPLDGKVLKEYEFKKSEFKKLDYEKQKGFRGFEREERLDRESYKKAVEEYNRYMEQVKREHDKILEKEFGFSRESIEYIDRVIGEFMLEFIGREDKRKVKEAEEFLLEILRKVLDIEVERVKDRETVKELH